MATTKEKEKQIANAIHNRKLNKLKAKEQERSTNAKVKPERKGYKLKKGIREGFATRKEWDPNK